MSDELKPCPFCGGDPSASTERVGNSTWLTFVRCGPCAFDMQMSKWNRRPIEDALRAELEEAREAIRDAAEETSGTSLVDDERLSYEEIQVTRGWRNEWRGLPAVSKALESK